MISKEVTAVEHTPLTAKIVSMRHKNSYIITLVKEAQSYYPFNPKDETYLDALIALKRVLNILDDHKLPYSKSEVRKAFNSFWDDQCPDKKGYFAWISRNALNKTIYKPQVREKNPIACISGDKSPLGSPENRLKVLGKARALLDASQSNLSPFQRSLGVTTND